MDGTAPILHVADARASSEWYAMEDARGKTDRPCWERGSVSDPRSGIANRPPRSDERQDRLIKSLPGPGLDSSEHRRGSAGSGRAAE